MGCNIGVSDQATQPSDMRVPVNRAEDAPLSAQRRPREEGHFSPAQRLRRIGELLWLAASLAMGPQEGADPGPQETKELITDSDLYRALEHLWQESPLTPAKLRQRLGMSKPTLDRRLRRLRDLGLVASEGCRRAVRYRLTEHGKRVVIARLAKT